MFIVHPWSSTSVCLKCMDPEIIDDQQCVRQFLFIFSDRLFTVTIHKTIKTSRKYGCWVNFSKSFTVWNCMNTLYQSEHTVPKWTHCTEVADQDLAPSYESKLFCPNRKGRMLLRFKNYFFKFFFRRIKGFTCTVYMAKDSASLYFHICTVYLC